MIIERLLLKDFGIYAGEQWFDLASAPENGKNVILIRGHNGGGKTTFFEAIRLVLYGKRALGPRVSQTDYENHLLGRIYVGSNDRSASIRLDFARCEQGERHQYSVRRSWSAQGKSIIESLDISSDDELLEKLEQEDYEQYLQDLIPLGVSQLFFFDGEKIQNIADEVTGEDIRKAIHALLGLDLIEQLCTDLALYTARREGQELGVDFDELLSNRRAVFELIVEAEERRAALSSRRDQIMRQIERSERAFREEGGRSARDRNEIKGALESMEIERRELLTELRLAASGVLAFGLSPTMVARLAETAERMRVQRSMLAVREFVDSFETSLTEQDKKDDVCWSPKHFEELRSALISNPGSEYMLLDADPDWIIERLAMLHDGRTEEVAGLPSQIEANLAGRVNLERQLDALDNSLALDALDALKKSEYARGSVDTEIAHADEEVAGLRRKREIAERMWYSAQADLQHHATQTRSADLAIKAQQALSDFSKEILNDRVNSLKSNFVDCFNRLIRKSSLVKQVEVDPTTFAFQLVGQDGNIIPKADLSAGERQIFAISMLWALGRTSGCQLPIVIDTPFARMDHSHRSAIIRDYIPCASEQVILLCTDTELTGDLEKMIGPHVARTYEVSVPDGQRWTRLDEQPVILMEIA